MNKIIRLKDGERFVVTDRQTLLDIISFTGGIALKDAVQEEFDNIEKKEILLESNLKELLKEIYKSDVSDEVWMAAVNANFILTQTKED